MKFAIVILSFLLIATGCNRKLRQVESKITHTAEKDSTVETVRMVPITIELPADSTQLEFTLIPVSESPVTFKPQTFTSQNGRAKATTTVNEIGQIMTKANCDAYKKEVEVAVKDKERFRALYESEKNSKSRTVTIIKTPFWAYIAYLVCVALILLTAYSKFVKPLKLFL